MAFAEVAAQVHMQSGLPETQLRLHTGALAAARELLLLQQPFRAPWAILVLCGALQRTPYPNQQPPSLSRPAPLFHSPTTCLQVW